MKYKQEVQLSFCTFISPKSEVVNAEFMLLMLCDIDCFLSLSECDGGQLHLSYIWVSNYCSVLKIIKLLHLNLITWISLITVDEWRAIFGLCRKNGCSGVNRMNGVMLSGNTSAFTERWGKCMVLRNTHLKKKKKGLNLISLYITGKWMVQEHPDH